MEAFSHGLRVIPVLLDGATLPDDAELPKDIAGLSRRQYVPLRRRYTAVDLEFLANRIVEIDQELAEVAARHQPGSGSIPRQLPAAVAHSLAGRASWRH